jgi:DNA-binding transcriptional LysR family regulator
VSEQIGYARRVFDWSDVRVFLTVQRTGSFTAAAKVLRIDQTTVGRRIAALETTLGSKLFRRGRDGLELTPAGRDIVETAERMEEAALTLGRTAEGRDQSVEGPVRLTTFESMGEYVIAQRVAELHARHPSLVLDLNTDDRSLSLTRREADLAVRFGRPDQSDLAVKKLASLAYAVYASRSYLERHPVQRERLNEHPVITYSDDLPLLPQARWLRDHGGRIAFHSNNTNIVVKAICAGMGLGAIGCYVGDQQPELVRVVEPEELTTRDLLLVVHTDLQRVPRVRAVADWVIDLMDKHADLLAGRASIRT